MKRLSVLLGLGIFLALNLSAHEFYVIPNEVKEYKADDTVQINALSTHYFTVGEELEPVEVNEVYIVKNGTRAGANLPLTANRDRLWYETTYRLTDDTPVIVAGNRIGGYYSIFTDGGYADGNRADAEKANPGKTVGTSRYFAKYSKLYLNPQSRDTAFDKPLGHTLEIIPLENPASYRNGSRPRFRVLYNGQPLANAEIFATHDYYNYKAQDTYAQTGKTDAKGEVQFRITNPGLWIVRISDTRKSAHPGTDEDNNAAILVFAVR
jgi:uncharacterized GH25 family protein